MDRPNGTSATEQRFRHEMMLYAGIDDFVARASAFLREGVDAGEPALVMVPGDKIGPLQAALGPDADAIEFADMTAIGRNPARIIPAWLDFVEQFPSGTILRGIGEPVWAGRDAAEIVECHLHEALLNVAMHAPVRLLCPYDTSVLDPSVIGAALCTHPAIDVSGRCAANSSFAPLDNPLEGPLPPAPRDALQHAVHADRLAALRRLASERAAMFGLDELRVEDVVLAVSELAANSLRHGGGQGLFRTWHEGDALLFELSDAGHIIDPLAGRRRPDGDKASGRGLWITNQICDLVQVRSNPQGTTVRIWMRRG